VRRSAWRSTGCEIEVFRISSDQATDDRKTSTWITVRVARACLGAPERMPCSTSTACTCLEVMHEPGRVVGSEDVAVGWVDADDLDASGFSCGVPQLDRWVHHEAAATDRRPGRRVLVASVKSGVVGCMQVSAFQVEPPSGEAVVGDRASRMPIGAVLISKLAVDRAWQRRGVASTLGWQALAVAGRVAVGTGARLVVARSDVDQVDERWCVRFGFRPLAGHPGWGYLPVQDVQATMAVAGPGPRHLG
jgi:predicted N-acetyltransferase YhbS